MAKLFLVRHGKTVWSGTGRYQGFSDVTLNEEGQSEVKKLALRLAAENFAGIYSSDLQRACCTAETIAASHQAKVMTRPHLRELNFGHCEGLTFQQIAERYPQAVSIWQGVNCRDPFSGGESMSQLADRIGLFLDELKKWTTDDNILVVGHSGALAVMICLLLDIGIEHWWQFKTANASVSLVETFERGAVLSLLNDLHHLDDGR